MLAGLYPAIDLAKFQKTTADSSADGTSPTEATDGIVSNDSRWYPNAGPGGHWLEVELTTPYPVGSAQLFLGKDDSFSVASFEIQFHNGSTWQTITSVTDNTATDLNLVFPAPIESATRFRFFTDENAARVKEFVLLPPTQGGEAHFLGTDVNLNLASQRAPSGSSVHQEYYAIDAVDGWADDDSRWLANGSGEDHSIEFSIPTSHEIGSLHLYSGFESGGETLGELSNFTIEYANGSGWTPIAGGTVSSGSLTGNVVTGNTSPELTIEFAEPVLANKLRLSFTGGFGRIRELVVLPANVTDTGESGYPLGVSVNKQPKASTAFATFGDDWFRIASRENNNSLITNATGSSQANASTLSEEKQFQLLYSYASDAYRIRNQDTGKTIEVADASMDLGAAIVEGDYSAAPHQLWQLEPTSGGYFQIVNVWSGMVLETDGLSHASVTQQLLDDSSNPANSQEWQPIFQDSYFKKGTGGWVGQYRTGWAYDWARNDPNPGNQDFFYVPMQHRQGWPNLTTLHKKYHDWNNDARPAYLLGFNEPDRPDQANMSVSQALALWPQLMALDVPLVSPAPAQGGEDWWLTPFMDQADNLGYRTDYGAGHWYSSPSVDNLFNHINDIQNDSNGRKVWLTEFSVVDWSGGSGNWSEESNYNFILEFLWRAESKNNLDKYAVFLFSGSSPANPWDKTNPRSNFFSGGSLTPFGKAYAAWEGDTAVRDDTSYIIHNRNARHRLENDGGSSLQAASIRTENADVQWSLQDAGNGKKYITSNVDGRRLSYDGASLSFAANGAEGTAVEWTIQQEQYGWHNIVHAETGEFLRLNRVNDANNAPISQTYEMVSASAASGFSSTDWWFVKPHNAVTPFDNTRPEISSAEFNWDTDQSIDVEFSKPIDTATFDFGDFSITNLDTGQVLNERDHDVVDLASSSVTIEMLKPLADGNWVLEFDDGGFVDLAGNALQPFTMAFQVLAGDADGNGLVETADYDAWKSAFGSTSDLATDWNRDGVVNLQDYARWRENLGATLVPPPAAILDVALTIEADGLLPDGAVPTAASIATYFASTVPTKVSDRPAVVESIRKEGEVAPDFDLLHSAAVSHRHGAINPRTEWNDDALGLPQEEEPIHSIDGAFAELLSQAERLADHAS